MFLSAANYRQEVERLIRTSDNLDVAVAFWGKGADSLFDPRSGKNIRIVCNLLSGGTNPQPIRQLWKAHSESVRQCSHLHAKALLGDDRAVVGSANLSAAARLVSGEEANGWEEAGVLVMQAKALADMRAWFERIWADAQELSEADLRFAEEQWKKHGDQGEPSGPPVLDELGLPVPRASVYFVVWDEEAEEEAVGIYAATKKRLVEEGASKTRVDNLDFYVLATPFKPNTYVIDADCRHPHTILVRAIYRPIPELDVRYGPDGEQGWVRFVAKQRRVGQVRVNEALRRRIAEFLRSRRKAVWRIGEECGWVVPLQALSAEAGK